MNSGNADEKDAPEISASLLRMLLADFTNPYERVSKLISLACKRHPEGQVRLHLSWPLQRLLARRFGEPGDSNCSACLHTAHGKSPGSGATHAIPLFHGGAKLGSLLKEGEPQFSTDMIDLAALVSAELHAILYPAGDPESPEIVGRSPRFRAELIRWRKLAPSRNAIAIHGLAGTGKEYAARDIHRHSGRAEKPFVCRSAAAIPVGLEESTLFGYEKGAFTGAKARQIGWLELADGGTIFLDEIAKASLKVQALLLRVISERVIVRVGGTTAIPIDVRLIAASNENLDDLVAQGQFLSDLRDRLRENEIRLPSLRERLEDIEPLVRRFMGGYAPEKLDSRAIQLLQSLPLDGNIRELQQVCGEILKIHDGVFTFATVTAAVERVCTRSIPIVTPFFPIDAPLPTVREAVAEFERRLVREALARCNGDCAQAAKMLNIGERTLRRLLTGK